MSEFPAMDKPRKAAGNCSRCHRVLKDPVSIKRGMGPVCWARSNGDVFEHDLDASPEEWERRAKLLTHGGEIDLGVNWQYLYNDTTSDRRFICTMRVSVRYQNGMFEAYGHLMGVPSQEPEVVFERGTDLQTVYAAAVKAGPEGNAMVYAARKAAARRARMRGVA